MTNDTAATMREKPALLEVVSARQTFGGGLFKEELVALDEFSLHLPMDEPKIVALAGESGSGKSTAGRLVLGFSRPTLGKVLYCGDDVSHLRGEARARFRREVQAVLQDPYEAYNPFYRIDRVFWSVIKAFKLADDTAGGERMISEALDLVGLRADETMGKYPHQLSGGQRQRLMIARAFMMKPRLIVADEPVSMIDASRRAQILEIIMRLKSDFRITFLYITHDLSTAYAACDDIIILNAGNVVERGPAREVIDNPQHDYTRLLVNSIPVPDPSVRWAES